MPMFDAVMRVTHVELWSVEAENEHEAREKFDAYTDDVEDDTTGGDIVNWEITSIRVAEVEND